MSTNIVDVATFTAPVVVPSAGDLLAAATTLATAQALANRTAFLNAFPMIRQLGKVQGAGTVTSYATVNTGALTDIAGITTTVNAQTNDVLVAVAQAQLAAVGLTVGRLQLMHSSSSLAQIQLGAATGEVTLNATINNGMITLVGYAVAGFTETYTVKMRGFDELGAGLSIRNNWSLQVFCLRGA
jgi:hypothetical protein